MTFRSKPVLVTLALGMSVAVHAQTLPYDAQFRRLLGEPTETVSALLTYPWKDNIQISPPGLNNISHGELIRIVSAERPVSAYDRWSHWTNSDGTVWVDVVDFSSKTGAAELLSSADQPYSGFTGRINSCCSAISATPTRMPLGPRSSVPPDNW